MAPPPDLPKAILSCSLRDNGVLSREGVTPQVHLPARDSLRRSRPWTAALCRPLLLLRPPLQVDVRGLRSRNDAGVVDAFGYADGGHRTYRRRKNSGENDGILEILENGEMGFCCVIEITTKKDD